jgi:hypothetical protein
MFECLLESIWKISQNEPALDEELRGKGVDPSAHANKNIQG